MMLSPPAAVFAEIICTAVKYSGLVSIGFWLVVGFAVVRSTSCFQIGDVIRIRAHQRRALDGALATKLVLQEERRYDHNIIVHYSWEENLRALGEHVRNL